VQHVSSEMRLLAPLLGLTLFALACSGSATTDLGVDDPMTLPEPEDAASPNDARGLPVSDGGPTTPPDGSVGDLATMSLTIDKATRPITLVDPSGFVPTAKLSADGKSLEIRAWVTPPNTHDGGYAVEESVLLTIPMKLGKVGCGQGSMMYLHSRLYDLSPPGAPVYNPFESFQTKAAGGACSISTTTISDTWVEGSASGTLTRVKNINGTSAASLTFAISYRVPRR
jgi:hypothetical protein